MEWSPKECHEDKGTVLQMFRWLRSKEHSALPESDFFVNAGMSVTSEYRAKSPPDIYVLNDLLVVEQGGLKSEIFRLFPN